MFIKRILVLLCASVLFQANASQCDINFHYGVVINPRHVRMVENGQTRIQINHNDQLFIDGKEQILTPAQQHTLTLYSQGIRKEVPAIITVALDGVDLGLKSVNKLIASLTGENSASHQKIQEKFNELQAKLHLRFNQTTDNYYIAPQDFANFDEIFTGEFEHEIEKIVSNSVGTILVAVGEAMASNKQDNFEKRIKSNSEHISNINDDLKQDMQSESSDLEHKTDQFCHDLTSLNQIENQLQQSIPSLRPFDLIDISHHKRQQH